MRFERSEIKTGVFVVATFGLLLLVVLYLSAPGIFRDEKEFEIFLDNTGGLKPGAAVNLAGRKIGQVLSIESPVPKKLRPTSQPTYEVLVSLRVDATARVYRDASARIVAFGLLAEYQVDFVKGNEESGLAERGSTFIGEREGSLTDAAAKAIKTLEPVALAAETTLKDLRVTIGTLNGFFGQGSELQTSITSIRHVGENITMLTAKDGSLGIALENIRQLTGKLAADKGDLMVTLAKLKDAADQLVAKRQLAEAISNLRGFAEGANRALAKLEPALSSTLHNMEQLTDTLKRQPWRVIFPVTKKYPDDNAPRATPTPASKPRKAVKAQR